MLSVVFLSAVYNGLRSCISTAYFQSTHLCFEFKEKIAQKLMTEKILGAFVFGSQG